MKNFLIRKNNVAVSAYITDDLSQITTNGALTIVDNSDPSNNIKGLPPNSYCLFLDNQFLASGYGFSSYLDYYRGSYIANSYEGMCSYIINELDKLHNHSIDVDYTYNDKKIDIEYTTYGWIKSYKTLEISKESNTLFKFELIDHKELGYINNISFYTSYNQGFVPVDTNTQIYLNLYKNVTNKDSEIISYAPTIKFNNEPIDLNDVNSVKNKDTYFCITRDINYTNNVYDKNFELICTRNNEVVYHYIFENGVKWRHKILPFNTKDFNLLYNDDYFILLHNLNTYRFSDIRFGDISQGITNTLKNFIRDNINNFVFLDDTNTIEYEGIEYTFGSDTYNSSYDYFIVEAGTYDFDFYFNDIKNNNWNYITFEYNNKDYRLYQSPQKYIGKHNWKIKYNHE